MNWELFLSQKMKDKKFNYVRIISNPHVVNLLQASLSVALRNMMTLLHWTIIISYNWALFLPIPNVIHFSFSLEHFRAMWNWTCQSALWEPVYRSWWLEAYVGLFCVGSCLRIYHFRFPIENWEIWYSPVRTNKTWYRIISHQSLTDFYSRVISRLSGLDK